MRNRLLPLLCILVSLPALARAEGVNMRWDHCFGDGDGPNRTFACDTNTGLDPLVLSFELDTPMTDVAAVEIYVELASASPVLPEWWSFMNAGTCRQTALRLSLTPPGEAVNCVSWAIESVVAGGLAAYNIGFRGPHTARIVAVSAVPDFALATLAAGQEYFAASLVINHSKTVGAGACAGCDVPVCIVLQRLNVVPISGTNSRRLEQGANGQGSRFVFWQNGGSGTTCSAVTHSRPSTWGQVKALFR